MKHKLFTLMALFAFSITVTRADIIVLKNNKYFSGSVVSVDFEKHDLIFNSKTNYSVPLKEIRSVYIEDTTSSLYRSIVAFYDASNPCVNGQVDADAYHGKKVGHFVLGVLFGPFAMLGTAFANPTPQKGVNTIAMSKNSAQFSDPAYLLCYKKEAKGTLIMMESLGWLSWVLLVAILR